jgi:hypothetical protein
MRRGLASLSLLIACLAPAPALDFFECFASGYRGDLAGTIGLGMRDLIPSIPIGARLTAGAVYQFDSGDATAARHIFINDNEGGSIEKWGLSHVLSLDITYKVLSGKNLRVEGYGGPRVSFYSAHFGFIGNNEVFAARSDSFGLGGGMQAVLRTGPRLAAVLSAGAEFYFPSRLYAHGTYYYTPSGVDQVPREDYTYKDADAAVNQPKFIPVAILGFEYSMK